MTVLGGKTLWDTYNVIYDKQIKGRYTAEFALLMTKWLIVTFDSL